MSLAWHRLQRLTLGEIACRGRQGARKFLDRHAPRLARRAPCRIDGARDEGSESFETFLQTAPRRFFAGATHAQTPALLEERLPQARRDIVAAAETLMAGRFNLLGYTELDFGSPIDWHLDPVAGRRAPAVHWSRLNPLDPAVVGDSKVVWELNRHQWLVTLAQAYRITGQPRFADAAIGHIEDWLRANPYGVGINWSSSLEVALRLIAWSWVLMLLRQSPALPLARFRRLRVALRAHALHVERYLSYYYSPNTHLTGEALGLLYAGIILADTPDAARWRDTGRRILIAEAARQVLADGVYFEQATCYHRYTVEIYLHFLVLSLQNGMSVPADIESLVVRMVEWLLTLCRPDAGMPAIGDADGGWLLPLEARQPGDCRGVFAVAAALFDRPDFAWAAGGLTPEVVWLLGPDGVRRFGQLGLRAPAVAPSRAFAEGGYAVMRSGWHPDGHQCIVDIGPLGCPISGAHGHADLLSVQCSAFGEDYLIDPGTFCYTADAKWRNYFRSTSAHNTVVVDGLSQAEAAGPFSWRARPNVVLHAWESVPTHDFVDAEHDGYTRLPKPVRHRRRVLFVKPLGWVIVDDLTGTGEHHVEVRFHFSPRLVTLGPDLWGRAQGRRGQGLWIAPVGSTPMVGEIRQGQVDPIDGWHSPAYGARRPSPVLIYSTFGEVPMRITTVIVPAEPLSAAPPALDVLGSPTNARTSFRFPGDERVIHVAADALTLEAAEGCLRIA
jgi:hypothetical protein